MYMVLSEIRPIVGVWGFFTAYLVGKCRPRRGQSNRKLAIYAWISYGMSLHELDPKGVGERLSTETGSWPSLTMSIPSDC